MATGGSVELRLSACQLHVLEDHFGGCELRFKKVLADVDNASHVQKHVMRMIILVVVVLQVALVMGFYFLPFSALSWATTRPV